MQRHPIFLICNFNMFSHPRLGFPGDLFPCGFPIHPSLMLATCSLRLILLKLIILIILAKSASYETLRSAVLNIIFCLISGTCLFIFMIECLWPF
jgi:hypothetical protein